MKKTVLLVSTGIIMLLSGCSEVQSPNDAFFDTKDSSLGECQTDKIQKYISGNSMEPMLLDGEYIWFLPDYYTHCNAVPEKGDLIAYDFSGREIPVIKTVIATEHDSIQIKDNTLWINGEEVKNSALQKYTFSAAEQSLLTMSIQNMHLPANALLILGDNVYNSQDSRKFGAISVNNVLGKFEQRDKEEKNKNFDLH